jgi:hypothetical protein
MVEASDRFTQESRGNGGRDKGCRCGRTKCLKQYCACFRQDIRCTKDCACSDCRNDGHHEEERMIAVRAIRLNSKEAFKGTDLTYDGQTVTTPRGSVKQVRGCRCRRSKCLKKYCECFGVGLKCGENCVCEDCLNGNNNGGLAALSDAVSRPKNAMASKAVKSKTARPAVTHPPVDQKTSFKPQPVTAASAKISRTKKPPLSVHIPIPVYPPAPLQRDLPVLEKTESGLSALASTPLPWGMNPLGSATASGTHGLNQYAELGWDIMRRESAGNVPAQAMQLERENSLVPYHTPRDIPGPNREVSLPLWQFGGVDHLHCRPLTDATIDPNACRNSVTSWGRFGFYDSPKAGRSTPRSPLKPLPSAKSQAPIPSPSMAIFSAAERMLPLPSPSIESMFSTISPKIQ